MLFLFKFFPLFSSSLVRFAALSFFKSTYPYSEQEKMPNQSCKVATTFSFFGVFGTPVLWVSSDLLFCLFVLFPFFSSVFPIFFFHQKPDVFDPENCGTVDDLHNTQKESNQQKHRTCLFTDACQHFPFLALPKQQHTSCIDRRHAVKLVSHNTWSYGHADKEQSYTQKVFSETKQH